MPSPAYMTIKDDQGNVIKGGSTVKGREGTVEVLAFDHQVFIPNDRDTGNLTGTRKHDPINVIKEFDATTPELYKACASGKKLQEVSISWYKIDDHGNEKEYFRHTLNNVRIVLVMPKLHHTKDNAKDRYVHEEQVGMRYEKIKWEYLDGNISSEDQWNVRSV